MVDIKILKSDINRGSKRTEWDIGNKILYGMCKEYPYHKKVEEVVAKVWLIGRAYAAAIERNKSVKVKNEDLYTNKVAPAMVKADIDKWLLNLVKFSFPTYENIEDILIVHYKLLKLLKKITGMKNRSLASKYLHFHKPNLFFIYDSRAMKAIRSMVPPTKIELNSNSNIDIVYAKFCFRCLELRDKVKEKYNINLTPRELDKILLSNL